MPLVEYLGNSSPEDNTGAIKLAQAADGSPRTIVKGARALVSGRELVAMAANYSLRVIDEGIEKDPDVIPTKMPDGYNDDGYKKDEQPASVIFTPEAYPGEPDDESDESEDGSSSPSPATPVTASASPQVAPSGAMPGVGSPSPSPSPASPAVTG